MLLAVIRTVGTRKPADNLRLVALRPVIEIAFKVELLCSSFRRYIKSLLDSNIRRWLWLSMLLEVLVNLKLLLNL